MSEIAVITDIHANLPALQAALARIDELGISEIYCGGDLVGYGPHPNEVCALIAEREIPTIYGNYDYAIARDHRRLRLRVHHARTTASSASSPSSGRSRTPTGAPRTSCASCRSTCTSASATTRVHLVHGSPRKVNEYLFEDKPARLYERLAAAENDRRARLRPHPQAVDARVRRRAVRQLRLGRQAQGRRSARRLRGPRPRRTGRRATPRSSGSPTTPRPSRAKSPRPDCPPSTPTSS